ncbi:hypothetical protein X798_05730 [Onchocerca flexuosa]|uniref:Proteasome component Ecm29 N-terminal domain-containing protein n=1 Tax=Onchocerca flexuosa TaxID=387005 RepID=A0A238BPD8_9BILA|nr:hypothetical protein X798_05730 [Onchocerca flexuosa]
MVITGTNSEICFEWNGNADTFKSSNQKQFNDNITVERNLALFTVLKRKEYLRNGMDYSFFRSNAIKLEYKNFAIVYLRIALDRVDAKDHITLLPNLLDILLKYINDRKIFDHLISDCMPYVIIWKEIQDFSLQIISPVEASVIPILSKYASLIIVLTARAWISIADVKQQEWPSLEPLKNKVIRSEILRFFSDVLYFPNSSIEKRNMAIMLNNFSGHPCISKNGFLRIAKDVMGDLKISITALKLSVIKLLSSVIFTEAEILPLLIGAIALGPSEVEIAGDVAIKKIDLEKVLRNKDTVKSLFNLYLGLSLQKLDESDRVLPATVPVKLKLMPLLMRSPVAIQTFPCNIKVAFDGLFDKEDSVENNPLKLQQASIDFLLLITKNFPASSVVAIAYQCFGIIGSKVPQLVVNDMALLQKTFDAIPLAPEELSFAIADCLVSWLPAFHTVNDLALSGVLEALISSYIVHESPKCRLVALKFVETLVKTPSLEFRWMLCRTCGDP